jgi:hypothetical protein
MMVKEFLDDRARMRTLPDGCSYYCNIVTKENSDLFIDSDMTPEDLHRIANYMEIADKKRRANSYE